MTRCEALGELDSRLLAAHEGGDPEVLARLYSEAAALMTAYGATHEAAFLLTQALVFALEAGAPAAADIAAELRAAGRHD